MSENVKLGGSGNPYREFNLGGNFQSRMVRDPVSGNWFDASQSAYAPVNDWNWVNQQGQALNDFNPTDRINDLLGVVGSRYGNANWNNFTLGKNTYYDPQPAAAPAATPAAAPVASPAAPAPATPERFYGTNTATATSMPGVGGITTEPVSAPGAPDEAPETELKPKKNPTLSSSYVPGIGGI